jgi:hypothetical protein
MKFRHKKKFRYGIPAYICPFQTLIRPKHEISIFGFIHVSMTYIGCLCTDYILLLAYFELIAAYEILQCLAHTNSMVPILENAI